jgi:peptidoglycan/LPS O-acetylase OafA/YrhL
MHLTSRLRFIDGLRGVAACAVMLCHLSVRTPTPWLGSRGYLGVAIFFVLSGFVIAKVVGDRTISAAFLWRFAMRRAVRLDVPYWISIALGVALMAIAMRAGVAKTSPTLPQIFAHLFYLQEILGYPEVGDVYWTLCFEVQFYLLLILILWAAQRLHQGLGSTGFAAAFLFSIGLSVLLHTGLGSSPRGLMWSLWWAFGLGALCYWTIERRVSYQYLAAAMALLVASGVAQNGDWRITAALTAGALLLVDGLGMMGRWLADPVMQFLGRISYSLYLLHGFIGWSTQSFALRYMNPWAALLVGIAASVTSAYIAYQLVERPSIRLSHRVRPGTEQEPEPEPEPLGLDPIVALRS